MCLTRFLSSAEDACNACCLISPQRPICAPQLAQVTALCSASSGSTTSARQPHLTQRRSNGTGNESIGEYAFQTATHLVLAKGLRASLWLFPWPRLSLAKGTARKLTKGDSLYTPQPRNATSCFMCASAHVESTAWQANKTRNC